MPRPLLLLGAPLLLVLGCALGACSDETTTAAVPAPPLDDGGQVDGGCGVGRLELADGGCLDAGVPPETCGAGFEPDGEGGCRAILPDGPCPEGLMAVPGETACREIAPCGDGPWGDAPIDATTQFVDQSYGGADSDGSELKPWLTIQQGIDAAAAEAMVAIAAGSYAEDLQIGDRPVTLWGRCPALVQVTGAGDPVALVQIGNVATSGTVLRGLALSGGVRGVILALTDVLLDQVWLHGASVAEAVVEDSYGPASLAITGSLIEDAAVVNIATVGAPVSVDASVVRDTLSAQQSTGGGLLAQPGGSQVRASIALTGSVVENNKPAGVVALGSDLQIERSVVRDTIGTSQGSGAGIGVEEDASGAPSTLTLRSSVVAHNQNVGLVVQGSDVTVEYATFVDQQCDPGGENGEAITIQYLGAAPAKGVLTLRSSRIARAHGGGIRVVAAKAVVEGVLLSDIAPQELDGRFGRGVEAELWADTMVRGVLEMKGSVVARATEAGIVITASDATIEDTLVEDTAPRPSNGAAGRAMQIQNYLNLPGGGVVTVRRSRFERQYDTGVIVADSSLTFEDSVLRDVLPELASGLYGDGISVASLAGPAQVTVRGSRIDTVARAGVSAFGASVSLERSTINCTTFALDAESLGAAMGTFEDLGGNVCGCADAPAICQVVSAQLAPPLPVD